MSNEHAPEGKVFVCVMCGKRSRDLYGTKPISRGWDESCVLHARLFAETELILDDAGRVTGIKHEAKEP